MFATRQMMRMPPLARAFSNCPITGMFTARTRELLGATIPAVADAGTDFTKHFYKRMFKQHPELLNIFNNTNQKEGKQSGKLFSAVATAAIQAAEKDERLPQDALESISHKHVALGITPEQYDVVAENILGTIKELLTDDQAILDSWAELYGTVASDMISTEAKLYLYAKAAMGGWVGQREFVISERTAVSDTISRLTFKPVDGQPVAHFRAGQYTTVWVKPEGWEYGQPRHYTLAIPSDSSKYSSQYEVSIKKQGQVSGYLHDAPIGTKINLSPPCGVFNFGNTEAIWHTDAPVVFLSGGVGITPALAMVQGMPQGFENRKISWLHGSQSGNVHAYRSSLIDMISTKHNMTRRVWYSSPSEADGSPEPANNKAKFHYEGHMDLDKVPELLHLDNPETLFFVCGPGMFESYVNEYLSAKGVDAKRIISESF